MLKQEKIKSRLKCCAREPYSETERILSEHRDIRDFFEMRADQAARREKVAPPKLSGAEYNAGFLLEEQKDCLLSEARTELEMQELRVENADRALKE